MIGFEDVSKSYPDGTEAVRNFSLEAPTGQTTVLVGSSGCGKTTLLRMINRMVDPTSGIVRIDDENIAEAGAGAAAAPHRLRDAELRTAAAPQGDRQHRDGAAV